jgi:hypothetical protein
LKDGTKNLQFRFKKAFPIVEKQQQQSVYNVLIGTESRIALITVPQRSILSVTREVMMEAKG